MNRDFFRILSLSLIASALMSCSSVRDHRDRDKVLLNPEFDQALNVQELPVTPPHQTGIGVVPKAADQGSSKPVPRASPAERREAERVIPSTGRPVVGRRVRSGARSGAKAKETGPALVAEPVVRRLPDWEPNEGFDLASPNGRTPSRVPFRVGEKVVLEVSWSVFSAGTLSFETRRLAQVNGRPAYEFYGTAKTYTVFDKVYSVDDWFKIYFDSETWLPLSQIFSANETGLIRQSRSLFDWKAGQARFWDKKITRQTDRLEETSKEWALLPWSQGAFSALFYLRAFRYEPGAEARFRVTHEQEDLLLSVKALRREEITTKAGVFKTLVLRPTATKDGQPKDIGEIDIWVTDDDRKLIVRIHSKLRFGTLKADVIEVVQGQRPTEP